MANNKLSWKQRRFLTLLSVPAFGLALSSTVVTTYLPVFIERFSGPAVNGIMIGGEGIFALWVPIVIGTWSDSLRTRFGRRAPFVLAATALALPALILMPLVGSLAGVGVALAAFFIAYFAYFSPYYALYPDLVPDEMRGRSQGFQGTLRSIGLLAALVGGGLLLSLWKPLPFLAAALALAGATAVFLMGVRNRLSREGGGSDRRTWLAGWNLVRENRDIRYWFVAASLWEATIATLKAFIVLYATIGLGLSYGQVAGALAVVGGAALVAAPVSGKLADRYGHGPVMLAAVSVFAAGLLVPLFFPSLTLNPYFLAGIVPFAFAAVVLMTLPYSVLMGLIPGENHGAAAGLFGLIRGVGTLAGPLVAGFAIQLLQPVNFLAFSETQGYVAMFPVASAFLLASLPLLRRMNTEGRNVQE